MNETAALVERKGGVIAGGDGQLDQFEARVATGFFQCGLHQLPPKPLLLISLGHVHAEQGDLVPGLLPWLECKTDNTRQLIAVEGAKQPIQGLPRRFSHQLKGIEARSATLEVNAWG